MVIYTYSVIIQNKKTLDAFTRFEPFFMEAINNNRIGVCKWNESGTTIDTAIPEIRELTNDKEEWCAIIVRFEDDDLMSDFESGEQNPYDFVVNRTKNGKIEESEIPLIRLTHMLGTIPAPEQEFVCESLYEEGKAPRVIYKPVDNSEQERAYKALCNKYESDIVPPSSIMIVTVREGYTEDNLEKAWNHCHESNSSKFWKINRYPSECRFLVYDFVKKGPVQREADEFGFWLAVLMLATNTIETGTLQAYRLYNLKLKLDKKLLTESFQNSSDRLRAARHSIEKNIQRDIEEKLKIESELPSYKIKVPVVIRLTDRKKEVVDTRFFKLLCKTPSEDIMCWDLERKEIKDWLEEAIRITGRTLDQTAIHMKDDCTFAEDEVDFLDKYQEEDMIRETDEIYKEIIELQGHLPMENLIENPDAEESIEAVHEYLKGRVIKKYALTGLAVALGLVFLANAPAIAHWSMHHVGSILQILVVLLAESAGVILAAWIILLIQKGQLDKLIERYNIIMSTSFHRLVAESGDFSDYLSDIASHSRGYSYMNLSRRKKNRKVNVNHAKYSHIKAINILLKKIKSWTVAYHLDVDFASTLVNEKVSMDTSVSPRFNGLYTFELGNKYPVPVNNTGDTIDSPFNFVEKIEIIREDLYDDGENN